MPLIRPLDELDTDTVNQNQAYIAQRLFEYDPVLDFRSGALHDIVQHSHAILETGLQDAVDRNDRSRSLVEISKDPTLADDDTVDVILGNFGITRLPAQPAHGTVVVVLEGPFLTTISKGAIFVAGGKSYASNEAYAARLNVANVLSDTDRLLNPVGDGSGRFYFLIEVTALESGAVRLQQGDRLTPDFNLQRFQTAYAYRDFSGGFDAESNAELISRLQDGIAVKAPSNRMTMAALIRTTPEFERVLAISEIGFGDAEQIRYHSLFPVAFGGRRDLYVRTDELYQTTPIAKIATLVSKDASGGLWRFSLLRTEAPGFYKVDRVVDAGSTLSGSYVIVDDIRGFDLTGVDWTPDIELATEAAYSPFQTAIIEFRDPATVAEVVGTTRSVDVYVQVLPLLQELQDFLGDRERRPSGSDLLVRAAVPCFVGVNVLLRKQPGQVSADNSTIANALASSVNNSGFSSRISTASLAAEVQSLLKNGQSCNAIRLVGRIRRPDGSYLRLESREALEVPDEPKKLVSRRTVCFYLDPKDVIVSTTTDVV